MAYNVFASGIWRASTMCMDKNCVQVGRWSNGDIAVADSKNPDRMPHLFTDTEWSAFLAGVKAGEFDLSMLPHAVDVIRPLDEPVADTAVSWSDADSSRSIQAAVEASGHG